MLKEKTATGCEISCNCCKKRNSSLVKVARGDRKPLEKVKEMKE